MNAACRLGLVFAYVLLVPPGTPPNFEAPISTWVDSGLKFNSQDECAQALVRRINDSIVQRRGESEVQRAKQSKCVLRP
jgi:hypothetical protein